VGTENVPTLRLTLDENDLAYIARARRLKISTARPTLASWQIFQIVEILLGDI
jgi:hypothetical protein